MRTLFVAVYLAGGVWLGGWELAALVINDRYTISRLWQGWEGAGWTAQRYLSLVVLVFLLGHIVWGLFR